jgi:peroxiredoxin
MARAPRGAARGAHRAGGVVSGLIAIGAAAPAFVADASDGRRYALRELLSEGRVLLAFYPGNDTPG